MAGKNKQGAAGGQHAADRHSAPATGTLVAGGGPVAAVKPAPKTDPIKPEPKHPELPSTPSDPGTTKGAEPMAPVTPESKDTAGELRMRTPEPVGQEEPTPPSSQPSADESSMGRDGFAPTSPKLSIGDVLRCSSFTYLDATYDVKAQVVAVEGGALVRALAGDIGADHPNAELFDETALLEIPALKMLWPILTKRVVLAPGPAGVVGSWQHVESDYPAAGKNQAFDKRFRIAMGGEDAPPPKPRWKPPRPARAGYTWVRSKTALHCNCFNVKGNSCTKVPANEHVEVQSRIVDESRQAFEDV